MKTMWGAPEEVVFCKKCTISNQRPSSVVESKNRIGDPKPTIAFNADGVCSACQFAETKKTIDWEERERQLAALCDEYRSKTGNYDAVVCGSGGKDSAMVAHMLRTKYNMHPILVTWSPHIYTDIGLQNLRAWQRLGDHIQLTPNVDVHRKLTRLAFMRLVHPFQPFTCAQRVVGPRISTQLGVPLIMYGENPAEYGNPIEENERAEMREEFYADDGDLVLAGLTEDELAREHGITEKDLIMYRRVDPAKLRSTGTTVKYMGHYVPWSCQGAYYYASDFCGLQPAPSRTEGSFSKYSSLDDKIDDLHYFTGFIKYGLGRCSYDTCQEIRDGKIERDEGVALVRRYDGEVPSRYFNDCLEYMGITKDQFWERIDSARPEHLWVKDEFLGWQLRHPVWA